MRVLLLCTQSPFEGEVLGGRVTARGGAELSLRLIGEMLAARGHDVHFLTRKELVMNREDRIDDVNVIHRFFVSVPFLARWSEAFRRFNLMLDEVQWGHCIQRVIDRHDIQIIHSFATYPDTYVAVRAGERNGIPVVQRIGGLYWRSLWDDDPSVRGKILYTFRNVDRLLPNSPNLSDTLIEFARAEGIDVAGSTSVLDIGIDFRRLDAIASERAGDGPAEPLLLCAASFKGRQKRQDILIEALGLLHDRGVDIRTCLVGDGPNRPSMERRAERLGLGGSVRFLGNIAHDDVIRLMGRATAYVHPSDFEGLSKSIGEAMYLGLPIIASDVPGIDLLLSRESALLVENNPESFAEAILLMTGDPTLRESLGRNARRDALERLDPHRNVVEYERLFQELISGS